LQAIFKQRLQMPFRVLPTRKNFSAKKKEGFQHAPQQQCKN